ncbi:MAG: YraN family protein [Coriobacteriia bacterium]|nr:YraN family protein [Coriobacteriia bacterium]
MTEKTTELGVKGEAAAVQYLQRIGMTIAEQNWRCATGEVDIIALDGTDLVFVEVKTRRTSSAGTPEDAVSRTKQKRLVRLARAYMAHAGVGPSTVRFDVIAIRVLSEDRALLRHHRAAFLVES